MLELLSLSVFVLVFGAGLLAWWSHRDRPATGLVADRLRPCPATPNCVCSESDTAASQAVAPLPLAGGVPAAWIRARSALVEAGGRIEADTDDYLWATFRSPFWRFVDDVELRLDPAAGVIQIRSGARVGHSDLGVNRRRVEALRARISSPGP